MTAAPSNPVFIATIFLHRQDAKVAKISQVKLHNGTRLNDKLIVSTEKPT
jgi:hypothetical protein